MEQEEYKRRKPLRIKGYDYSTAGAYFVTMCVSARRRILWNECRGALCAPDCPPLSAIGQVVDHHIAKLSTIYPAVTVDKYCIMPDHIHMILVIQTDKAGRAQRAPTLSRIICQFKGAITKELGYSIWQRSYLDRIIRDDQGYQRVWEYIDNNPRKVDFANDSIAFDMF